ncbi:MAG TPA: ribosomal RNA small subunit methyltransferase I, partial [Armatimonadota bacterium]|nr:ribosomal RNA small subunit methyltransferase I [Armatimonadota bacterium]
GEALALVSDAGTPGISDPGVALVAAAIDAGAAVLPVPGPSAVVATLSASGLDPSRFVFEGFLPRGHGDQRKVLEPLRSLPHTLVFYEAPGRVPATLALLREALGDRRTAVARELTKRFEEFVRGKLSEVEAHFRETDARGECVIIVEGATDDEPVEREPSVEERLAELLGAGVSVRDASRQVSEELRQPRREVYQMAMDLATALQPPGGGGTD